MSPPLIYRAETRDDIDKVYSRYEGERSGLGERFLSALGELLDGIRQNPEMYGVVFRDVLAVKVKGFPHVVYYRIVDSGTELIAVHHGARTVCETPVPNLPLSS